jgi:hypothetical protein
MGQVSVPGMMESFQIDQLDVIEVIIKVLLNLCNEVGEKLKDDVERFEHDIDLFNNQ